MRLPVLYDLAGAILYDLRGCWATGGRVAVTLERCDLPRLEGIVSSVSATGATARISGVDVPVDRILASHKPSRLGDSKVRASAHFHGEGHRVDRPGQLELDEADICAECDGTQRVEVDHGYLEDGDWVTVRVVRPCPVCSHMDPTTVLEYRDRDTPDGGTSVGR